VDRFPKHQRRERRVASHRRVVGAGLRKPRFFQGHLLQEQGEIPTNDNLVEHRVGKVGRIPRVELAAGQWWVVGVDPSTGVRAVLITTTINLTIFAVWQFARTTIPITTTSSRAYSGVEDAGGLGPTKHSGERSLGRTLSRRQWPVTFARTCVRSKLGRP
jgi:hypothetical protein